MNSLYTFPINLEANQTNYYWFEQGFSPEELSEIERLVGDIPYTRGVTQTNVDDSETFNEDSYRKSNIKWVPFSEQYKWIYDKIGWMANEANENMFKFDLFSMPEQIQYTEYYDYEQGHYDWHMDIGHGTLSQRKISVTVQLSDPDEYEGGDLQLWPGGTYPINAPRGKGNVVIFPSFMMHRVTPIIKGTRKSFVLWLGGGHYK
jgi:PKHD-type hydroxylase